MVYLSKKKKKKLKILTDPNLTSEEKQQNIKHLIIFIRSLLELRPQKNRKLM